MKKITFLLIGTLLFSSASFSQMSKDSLIKVMARETCEEIASKDMTGKSMNELKVELGLALMPVLVKYQDDFKSAFGYDMGDSKGSEKIGEAVGMQLATDCPAFLKIFMNNPDMIKEGGSSKKFNSGSINGTLMKIVSGDFSYLQVKDGNGKVEKLWWMEYFDGSNGLTADPKSMLNKQVKVNYVEKEMYNSTLNDYVKVKVITGIE